MGWSAAERCAPDTTITSLNSSLNVITLTDIAGGHFYSIIAGAFREREVFMTSQLRFNSAALASAPLLALTCSGTLAYAASCKEQPRPLRP